MALEIPLEAAGATATYLVLGCDVLLFARNGLSTRTLRDALAPFSASG